MIEVNCLFLLIPLILMGIHATAVCHIGSFSACYDICAPSDRWWHMHRSKFILSLIKTLKARIPLCANALWIAVVAATVRTLCDALWWIDNSCVVERRVMVMLCLCADVRDEGIWASTLTPFSLISGCFTIVFSSSKTFLDNWEVTVAYLDKGGTYRNTSKGVHIESNAIYRKNPLKCILPSLSYRSEKCLWHYGAFWILERS